MNLIFENKIPENRSQFKAKIIDIAGKLDIDPNWLMVVMNIESGFNHKATNGISGATGLIQFLPDTAWALFNKSVGSIRAMSNIQQLDLVYKYYEPYKDYITNIEDLYLVTLYPNADGEHAGTLDKPGKWKFPDNIYRANKVLDHNKDGKLTIRDVKKYVYSTVPANWRFVLKSRGVAGKFLKRNWLPVSAITLLTLLLTIFLLNKYLK